MYLIMKPLRLIEAGIRSFGLALSGGIAFVKRKRNRKRSKGKYSATGLKPASSPVKPHFPSEIAERLS